ncbi:hypothetical protein EZV62_018159 [Acer yangbiense]|uniref:Zinc knuckle CX2CX4HX4C domain-containing protein n=1 Tax=Acer yangbiense TaxID=1000413 RepID=A0A5C7HKT2_9ROSI|nr:hypothetical protein EZV62_018159 [Acer yangbiense]
MGEFHGGLIGDLVDIDVGSIGECFGKHLKVRVAIDVSKPLKRFLDLSKDGRESLLLLRYEKLPEYCFCYGMTGHSYFECLPRKKGFVRDAGIEFDFGPWMRASNPPGGHKSAFGRRFDRGESSSYRGGKSAGLPLMDSGSNRKGSLWKARHAVELDKD